ncbi:BLUF domain-containing protein [Psychroflexus aestuariivivens]|uniref:BLUF domain-containing protein n=1 Tax=Psychroflexus aestuariivivens TaxID=1795040 RepID=UPI000FDC49D7|nr:BLUF domain-containing protein [Psychroflexus aestuariivivens]
MQLKFVSYMSSQTQVMTKQNIEDFLFKIREKNKRIAITGILLLIQGKFVQYIEGPAEEIDGIYDIIKNDKRHNNMILLDSGTLDERQFKNWSMAYKEVGDAQIKQIVGNQDLNLEGAFLENKNLEKHPVLKVLYDFIKTLSS